MDEAHFQYIDANAELQPCICMNCSLSATYSTGSAALCVQEKSCCLYACSTVRDHDSSTNSTPFVSAPSSPRKSSTPLYAEFSGAAPATSLAAASPDQRHGHVVSEYAAISDAYAEADHLSATMASSPSLSDFEFSSRLSEADAWLSPSSVSPSMSTAEELFYDGKIKPLNTAPLCMSCFGCFSDAVFDNQPHGYQDPAHSSDAYTERLPPSQHAEHHQQQQLPLMLKQKSSRHNYMKPTSTPTALEQWMKSMGKDENWQHVRQYAHAQHVEKVMQMSSLPLAHYSRNSRHDHEHHHRRARSLSPKRVFHIDEKMMQARASFESGLHSTKKASHVTYMLQTPRSSSRKRWTLKELLNMGDSRTHTKSSPAAELRAYGAESVEFGSALSAYKCRMEEIEADVVKNAKDNARKRSLEKKRWRRKSGPYSEGARPPWKLQQAEQKLYAHQQYSCSITGSEECQVEEIGKWNFLHDKKGWLGCLGFTAHSAKHNSSIKSLQSCIP